jgi:hypothetical protein
MKPASYLIISMLFLSGCATSPLGHALVTGGASALSGGLGSHFSRGDPWITAAAAGGGALAAEAAQAYLTKAESKAYREGYQQARSDAAKSQYWSQQQQQRTPHAADRLLTYSIPIPAQTIDGILYEPTTRILTLYP